MVGLGTIELATKTAISLCVASGGYGISSQLKKMATKKEVYKVFRKERVLEVIELSRVITLSLMVVILLVVALTNYTVLI